MAVWRHRGARQWENEGREDAFCLSGSQRWGILLSASDQYFPIGNSCNFVTGRCFTRTGSLRVTRAFPTPSLLLSLIQTLGYGWDLWLSYLVLQLFSYWKHLTISLPTAYKVHPPPCSQTSVGQLTGAKGHLADALQDRCSCMAEVT